MGNELFTNNYGSSQYQARFNWHIDGLFQVNSDPDNFLKFNYAIEYQASSGGPWNSAGQREFVLSSLSDAHHFITHSVFIYTSIPNGAKMRFTASVFAGADGTILDFWSSWRDMDLMSIDWYSYQYCDYFMRYLGLC